MAVQELKTARRVDYGRHRPGRRLSRRIPARPRLHRPWRIKRRSSSFNTARIDHLYQDPHAGNVPFLLHYGDMTDATNLIRLMQEIRPTEIYNLAAQSHVGSASRRPEYTANADALGTLRLLEAIRILGMEKETRFYQASTSELYGKVQEVPQKETTPFYPRWPYGVAKLYAYWITVNYREAYGMYRLQRHPVQSRKPDPRRDLRDAQDHARRRRASRPACRTGSISAISTPSATGAMRATMSRACGMILQQTSPTISCWRPARPARCANSSSWPSPKSAAASNGAARASTRPASTASPARPSCAIDPALFPPDRSRSAARRRQQGAREARLEAEDDVRRSWSRKWSRAISRRARREVANGKHSV